MIIENELKSSEEWNSLAKVVIFDPDGWDRNNFKESWNEPITWEEFKYRILKSTVQFTSEANTSLLDLDIKYYNYDDDTRD